MFHILRRGETFEQLSVRYGLPVCMILRANPNLRIAAGARLAIPNRDLCAPFRRYTVRRGDTIYRIAQQHGTTMYALLQMNSARELREGETILLPPPMRIYTCRAGDTVRSVAEQFGITEDALRRENGIRDSLYNGMQLILPED